MTKDKGQISNNQVPSTKHKLDITFAGECLTLLADRAVFWKKRSTLFFSDPHFGKDASMRSHSIPMPDILESELTRLDLLLRSTEAERVFILGDFYHDVNSITASQTDQIRDLTSGYEEVEFNLIRGNHDLQSGDPRAVTRINCFDPPYNLQPFTLIHDPEEALPDGYFLAGHLHPGLSLRVNRKDGARVPAFCVQDNVLVLPAFGRLTGNGGVKRKRNQRIVAIAGDQLIEIPHF